MYILYFIITFEISICMNLKKKLPIVDGAYCNVFIDILYIYIPFW